MGVLRLAFVVEMCSQCLILGNFVGFGLAGLGL